MDPGVRRLANWAFIGLEIEYVAIAPTITKDVAKTLCQESVRPQSQGELIAVHATR